MPDSQASTTVSQHVRFRLLQPGRPYYSLLTELLFDPKDPYAVTFIFKLTGKHAKWTFARDLLTAGLQGSAGEGDVHIWAVRSVLNLEFRTPESDFHVEADVADMRRFVQKMERSVPCGMEYRHLNIDDTLSKLFNPKE